ncbi:MAG: glycosyltransferase family 4 protein [Planctomycetia bacterium]|nr:glycosyltransferase family 4 protein [Planctomycetia bacterium]
MRICLFTNTAFPCMGGQEMVVDELARQFMQAGHEPVMLCPVPPTGYRASDSQYPYPVVRHPKYVSTKWLVEWYRLSLYWTVRKYRSDVVHCHNVYPNGYLAVLERLRGGPPVVITSHGGDVREDNPRYRNRGLRERHQFAVQHADALVSIGPFTDQGFRSLGARPEQLHSIPNGVHAGPYSQPVDRPAELPVQLQSQQYLLFLGRLMPRKGVDVLLRALALWRDRFSGSTIPMLAVGGDGLERPALEKLTAELKLQQNVIFLGTVKDARKLWLLQNARLLMMPTREWEAFPMVLLEGFAAGCPVVASDAPGLKELITPGKTGWVVPRENPEALAEKLHQLWQQPALTRGISSTVQAFAQQCDWPVIACRHLELFESVVKSSQSLRLAS